MTCPNFKLPSFQFKKIHLKSILLGASLVPGADWHIFNNNNNNNNDNCNNNKQC
jgi:hypothetical protein